MTLNIDKDGNEIKIPDKIETYRKAAFEQLSKKAILVNVTRRQLQNVVFDITLSEKVAKDYGVSDDCIHLRKFLFNPERLSKIRSLLNDAEIHVLNHTRPWENTGFALLPMEYFDDFQDTFQKIKDNFEEAVKEFVDAYPDILKESRKMLGKAFDKSNYPDKSLVKDLFELEIQTAEFPDVDDVRLNLTGEELVTLTDETRVLYDDTLKEVMNDIFACIGHEENKDSIVKMLSFAQKLNITNDVDVQMQIDTLRAEFGVDEDTTEPDSVPDDMMIMSDFNEDEITGDDDEFIDFLG